MSVYSVFKDDICLKTCAVLHPDLPIFSASDLKLKVRCNSGQAASNRAVKGLNSLPDACTKTTACYLTLKGEVLRRDELVQASDYQKHWAIEFAENLYMPSSCPSPKHSHLSCRTSSMRASGW